MIYNRTGTDFRPLPLLGNPHIQTVLSNAFKGPALPVESVARLVPLSHGDQLVMHDSIPANWPLGGRIALLAHGLGGTHRSAYIQRTACSLLKRGVRVVRLDMRGSGQGIALARRPYHAGSSDDIRAAIVEMRRLSPESHILLAGFSLGGNMVLKLAGEARDEPVPGLERVAAVAPPIDLERCAGLIGLSRNRFYELHFLRELVALVRRRQRHFPDLPPVRFPRRLTLRIFDELYTAPRCGFADARDYYHRAASVPVIPRITTPTLILTARDDPFVAVGPFETLATPPQVEVHILPQGGHLGFLGWDGAGGIRWAERRVAQWLLQT